MNEQLTYKKLLELVEAGDTDTFDKLLKLAEEGDSDAQYLVGSMYINKKVKKVTSNDFKEKYHERLGIELISLAAEKGNNNAKNVKINITKNYKKKLIGSFFITLIIMLVTFILNIFVNIRFINIFLIAIFIKYSLGMLLYFIEMKSFDVDAILLNHGFVAAAKKSVPLTILACIRSVFGLTILLGMFLFIILGILNLTGIYQTNEFFQFLYSPFDYIASMFTK